MLKPNEFLGELRKNLQYAIQWLPKGAIAPIQVRPSASVGDVLQTTTNGAEWGHAILDTASATQSAIVSSSTATVVDVTGCSVDLAAGTWVVVSRFSNARIWVSAGTNIEGTAYYALRDSGGTTYDAIYETIFWVRGVDAKPFGKTLVTVLSPTIETTYKMSGYVQVITGTNFASGFRGDSGTGLSCSMSAFRIA